MCSQITTVRLGSNRDKILQNLPNRLKWECFVEKAMRKLKYMKHLEPIYKALETSLHLQMIRIIFFTSSVFAGNHFL